MMYYFFIYFAIYIAFLFVIGTVGISTLLVVRRKFKLTFFESLLTALFSGYIISITIFSIIQTCFRTVNILYIILLLFALWEVVKMPIKHQIEKKDIEWKLVLLLFGSTFLFYGLAFLSIYRPGCFIPFSYNHIDYIFYAKISKYISLTGEENIFNFLNKLDSYYNGPYPYHYFDTWGAALTNYLFGINHYLGLKLIIYPTFYFTFFIGVICLFQKPNPMKILFSFIIIWYGGFSIPEFQSVLFLKYLARPTTNLFSIYDLQKLTFFYAFILNSYLCCRQKFYVLSTICFLGLIVADITTATTVLIALFLSTLLSFRMKIISKEILYTNFIYLIIFSVLLVTFYRIFKSEAAASFAGDMTSVIQESFSFQFQNPKTLIHTIIMVIIDLLIPHFTVIFLLFKNRPLILTKNLPLIFVVTSILISASVWTMLIYELNSYQVFNFFACLINVSAIILIITSLENNILSFKTKSISTWFLNFLIILTIGTNVINTARSIFAKNRQLHSNEYLKKIYNSISENELIATLKSPTDMERMAFKFNAVYPLGDYLFLFDKNVNSVNIGDLDTPIDSTSKMNRIRSYKAIRDGFFYRFAQFDENKNLNKSDLTIKFLEKFNIKFIIATKSAKLPQFLIENAKSIITDSISGEKFIELNLKQKTINKH